jgi:hypothetical protein
MLPREACCELNNASRFSNSSYRTGYYRLFFGSSNILTLSFNGTDNSADYWPGVNNGRSQFSGTPTAGMDERGNFHSTDGYSFNTSDFGETPLRRLTLDPDGNLRAYSWDGNSLQWNIVWEAFTQLCTIFGLCGKNSLCIDTNTQNPHCACISGFRMANRSNWFAGCDPIHPIKPGEYNISSKLKLLSLKHSDFYGNDLYIRILTFKRNSCLNKIAVYKFQHSNNCSKNINFNIQITVQRRSLIL